MSIVNIDVVLMLIYIPSFDHKRFLTSYANDNLVVILALLTHFDMSTVEKWDSIFIMTILSMREIKLTLFAYSEILTLYFIIEY